MKDKYIIVDITCGDENPQVYGCSNLKEVKEELFDILMSYDEDDYFWEEVKNKNILLYEAKRVNIKKLFKTKTFSKTVKVKGGIGWKV